MPRAYYNGRFQNDWARCSKVESEELRTAEIEVKGIDFRLVLRLGLYYCALTPPPRFLVHTDTFPLVSGGCTRKCIYHKGPMFVAPGPDGSKSLERQGGKVGGAAAPWS